jgi:hypothetical protein
MAPPQSITVIDPLSWPRSTATRLALSELVNAGQLATNEDGRPPAWIDPPARDREPNPPFGYVVSFIRFHERGFAAPASRFLRGLCFHYGVDLHNFALNAISQAATFVGMCEGFLGIPVNWDLWVHLFRAELHTVTKSESKVCRAVCAGGVMITLRETRRELYIPYTMTSNNAEWERGVVLPPQRRARPAALDRQGREGEGQLLVAQRVAFLAPRPAGFSPTGAEGSGGRLADRGLDSRELLPPADHSSHGEPAPHL